MNLIFKEDIKVSDINLKELYDIYNRDVFNNQLPKDLPVVVSNTRKAGGRAIAYSIGGVVTPRKIEISKFFISKDDNRIKSILLHEMVHILDFITNGIRKDHHDQWFMNKIKEISDKTGIQVTRYDDREGLEVSDEIKAKEYDVLITKTFDLDNNVTYRMATFKKNLLEINKEKIKEYVKFYVTKYDIVYEVYRSSYRPLMKYSTNNVVNRLKVNQAYNITKELYNDIMENSELLYEIDEESYPNKLSDKDLEFLKKINLGQKGSIG